MKRTYKLTAGRILTVTAGWRPAVATQVENPSITGTVAAYGSTTFGPYALDRSFIVTGEGSATTSEAAVGAMLGSGNFAAFIAALPTADPEVEGDLWLNSGVLTVSAGA